MDENHLLRLNSTDYDVLICSDYQDLSPNNINIEKLNNYNAVTIISWSMGVFAANVLKKYLNNIKFSIAINGTLKPVDDQYGIPEAIFGATLNNFNADTREKFYKRMFKNNENFEEFFINQPKRNADEQKAELISLQNYIIKGQNDESSFDRVIIGKYDKIIPSKNQINAWSSSNSPIIIEEGHYPFFLWQSYEEIIEYAKSN